MTNTIFQAVEKVFNKYNLGFSNGYKDNLREWERNKNGLIDLLRNHPDWNEDAMAIIFDVTESRKIVACDVVTHQNKLSDLAWDLGIVGDRNNGFNNALMAATNTLTKTINDKNQAEKVKLYSGVSCAEGEKVSRVVGKI